MAISAVKRLAAEILNVGLNKIRFDPAKINEASGVTTREDVAKLIESGVVKKLPFKGRDSTAKRRRRSSAHIRGKTFSDKEAWMKKIRSQRKFLTSLFTEKAITREVKNSTYGKIKSGIFKNKKAMLLYLKDNSLISKDYEMPKKGEKK